MNRDSDIQYLIAILIVTTIAVIGAILVTYKPSAYETCKVKYPKDYCERIL